MTDDLVKRLLEPVDDPFFGKVIEPIKWEAANEIERLRSIINDDRLEGAADRIEQLEAALREIETLELDPRNSGQAWVKALRQIARAALEEKTDD